MKDIKQRSDIMVQCPECESNDALILTYEPSKKLWKFECQKCRNIFKDNLHDYTPR